MNVNKMASESRESVEASAATATSDSIFTQNIGFLRGGYDSDSNLTTEAYKVRVNNLKYSLETWREVLIHCYAVLIWTRPYHPMILWAVVSIFFSIVYYAELSALTTLAVVAMFAVLSDYLVPIMQAQIFNPSLWTGIKEKKYEEVCQGIATAQESFNGALYSLNNQKINRPSVYFLIVFMSLLSLAYVGSLMDNLLLTYVIVCSTMMVPGLVHRGYLQKLIISGGKKFAKKKNN